MLTLFTSVHQDSVCVCSTGIIRGGITPTECETHAEYPNGEGLTFAQTMTPEELPLHLIDQCCFRPTKDVLEGTYILLRRRTPVSDSRAFQIVEC